MFDPAGFLKTLGRTAVMGIVNVSGDSFSEGVFSAPASAVRRALALAEAGADILDLGAESTRPGAAEVKSPEECARLIPVLKEIRKRLPHMMISIDTRHRDTAEAALECGACIINDVSMGNFDPGMAETASAYNAVYILCHSRGLPENMQSSAYTSYPAGVRKMVTAELECAAVRLCNAGIPEKNIWFDPGVGFAKNAEQCREMTAEASLFDRKYTWVWGVSRKSFLGGKVEERGAATLNMELRLAGSGAAVIRTHDVGALRKKLAEL